MAVGKVRLRCLQKVQKKTGSQRAEATNETLKIQHSNARAREVEKIQKETTTKDKRGQRCKIEEAATFRVILALISAVIYANSLNAGFVYDDRRAILGNRNVQAPWNQFAGWNRLLTDDFWGTPLSYPGSHKSYRPLVTLTFKLQELAGRLFSNNELVTYLQTPTLKSASNFHLFNLLLHLLVVDQVFQLSLALFGNASGFLCKLAGEFDHAQVSGRPEEARKEEKVKGSRLRAPIFITGLLFACHPIHVEAVSSLVGRAELMGALFGILSFRKLASYLALSGTGQQQPASRRNLWLSMLFSGLACLSKENSAVSVILINVLMVVWHAWYTRPLHKRSQSTRGEFAHDFMLPTSIEAGLAMLSIALAMVALRIQLGGGGLVVPRFSYLDNPLAQSASQLCLHEQSRLLTGASGNQQLNTSTSHQLSHTEACSSQQFIDKVEQWRLMTRFYIPTFALALLAWPSELSYDWPLEAIGGLITSPLEWRFLASVLMYVVLCLVTFRCLREACMKNFRHRGEGKKLDSYCKPVKQASPSPQENDYATDTSDNGSTRSLDTNISCDSGFVDEQQQQLTHIGSVTRLNNPQHKTEQARSSTQSRESTDVLAWSLVWTLLPYLSASNLILPVGFLVAERTLYLPSVGFCLLVAHLLDQLSIEVFSRCLPRDHNLAETGPTSGVQGPQNMWCHTLLSRKRRRQKFKASPPLGLTPKRFDWFGCEWLASVVGDDRTAKLALIFPLLILGAIKTAHRSSEWHDERSLFSSNLRQASAKSMGNLASLLAPEVVQRSEGSAQFEASEALYREALRREPHSAELHYNLALLLHRRLRQPVQLVMPAIQKDAARHAKMSLPSEIEYHYGVALKLRPNFALAALNLAAYQYEHQNQLEAAWQGYRSCAFEMAPQETRTFQQHVRIQIECLISGARMRLIESRKQTNSWPSPSENPKQTSAGCRLLLSWLQAALNKASTVLEAWQPSTSGPSERGPHNHDQEIATTDLNKQLSSIYWLMAQCREKSGKTGTGRGTRCYELKESAKFGLRSRVTVEATVYIDYVECLLAAGVSSDKEEEEARVVLRQALKNESEKTSGAPSADLARLHQRLARLLANREALEQMYRAVQQLTGTGLAEHSTQLANYLAQAAQLAYQLRNLAESEQLYHRALEISKEILKLDETDDIKRRLLASAHVNYGAIVEVRGRRQEARQMYEEALVVDSGNKLAKANLRRLDAVYK